MLPIEATPTAVPVQKTSSASINSSIGITRSSTWHQITNDIRIMVK